MTMCSATPTTRFALVAVLLLAPEPAARAEGKEGGDAAAAFAQGKKLFESRDFIGAIARFEKAYRARPHHAVLCSIARCYENLNRAIKAVEHYRRCLAEGASATPMAIKIQNSLRENEARITWVEVRSPGRGGEIFVDGRAAGEVPAKLALDPGSHVLEVRRAGARPASATVDTLGGEQRTLTLAPEELREAMAAPAVSRPAEPQKTSRRRVSRAWFWSAVGLTAVCAVGAIVTGALTLKQRSDYEATPTREGKDAFLERRLATNILWGVAGAAAATGTVLFFFTDFGGRAAPGERAALGVGVRGAF
jgi:hypothetical protein